MDSEHISPETQRRHVPACIAQATADGRMFVTRDQRLAARPGLGALFLLSTDDAQGQLEEVVQHFGIRCAAEPLSLVPRAAAQAFATVGCHPAKGDAHEDSLLFAGKHVMYSTLASIMCSSGILICLIEMMYSACSGALF